MKNNDNREIMEKLTPMTDFVLEQSKLKKPKELANYEFNALKLKRQENYANFLKQELNIGMFIPAKKVNGEWVILEEPIDLTEENFEELNPKIIEFEEAAENVLFEGFELKGKYLWNKYKLFMIYDNYNESFANEKNIEWLVNQSVHEFTLTQSAKQKLGL